MSARKCLPSSSLMSDDETNYQDNDRKEQDKSDNQDDNSGNEESDSDYYDEDEEASQDEQDNLHNVDNTIDILEPFCKYITPSFPHVLSFTNTSPNLILLNHFQNFQHSRFYQTGAYIFRIVIEYVVQHDHGTIDVLVQFYVVYVQPRFQFRIPRNPALEQHVVRAVLVGRNGFRVLLRGGFIIVEWYRYAVGDGARDICMMVLGVGLVGTWVIAGFWIMLEVSGGFFLVTALLGWWD